MIEELTHGKMQHKPVEVLGVGCGAYEASNPHFEIRATEEAVEQALLGMLIGEWDVDNSLLMGCSARTYSDAGVLTYNKGLVITMPDGSEFQLTIVQSR